MSDDELNLFGGDPPARRGAKRTAHGSAQPDEPPQTAPLAARMRPRTLDDYVGQEHLLGPGKALRELIEKDAIGSIILWGPPGTGKTTLARIIAERTQAAFVHFSAVTEGVARVREIIAEARERQRALHRRTILFCDEIHRFNKAQQDAFLPHVEAGTIDLIGATTENPSFEVIGALLSRSRVFVLRPLSPDALRTLLRRALADSERGLGSLGLVIDDDALDVIAVEADGDARRALNTLEAAATLAGAGGTIDGREGARGDAAPFRPLRQGRGRALQHPVRLPQVAARQRRRRRLYWMARMIEGGQDPLIIFRRALAMAAEDIGMADPQALQIAVAARQAFQSSGRPRDSCRSRR
jgi:putative ATPase